MAGAMFVVCLPKGLLEDGDKTNTGPKGSSPYPEGGVQIIVTEADANGEIVTKERNGNVLKVSKKMGPKVDPKVPMETLLQQLLERVEVNNAVWNTVKNGKFFQVTFSVEAGNKCEECIKHLHECGFGVRPQTSLSVIPCTLFYKGHEGLNDVTETKSMEDMEKGFKSTTGKEMANGKLMDDPKLWNWEKFMTSVRARLTVAEVVGSVRAGAELTFDFVMLLIVAGMVAAMGLVENSSVSVVASMLISPLMGPILAGTFGIVIHDKQLKKIGVINELIGLALCILVGYIYGLVIGFSSDTYRYPDSTVWPTSEMISRGQVATLWVGILIALPSGAGAALGILGGNVSSLVGVAISASLLPPAVNAGLFWALATVKAVIRYDEIMPRPDYIYFEEEHLEYATLGVVSLCLTIINIICIFIAGILVLKVKEVAPQTNNEELRQFWQHDIRVARDYNRTLQGENASDLGRQLLKKLSVSRNFMEEAKHEIAAAGFNTSRHPSESGAVPHHKESVVSMNSSNNQYSWTSGNMHQRYMFHPRFHQKSNSGPSEEELERVVYSTLTADSKRGLLSSLGIIGVTGQSSKRKISSMSLPGNNQVRSPKISTCVEPQLDTIREATTNVTGEPETVLVSHSNRRFHITPCTEDR